MAFLQDFHHSSSILDYSPKLIAIACINLAFQVYGVVVPLMDECDQHPWFNVSFQFISVILFKLFSYCKRHTGITIIVIQIFFPKDLRLNFAESKGK